MFKEGRALDPIEGSDGSGTITDPREFYAWVETILLWLAAGGVLAMRHSGSLDAVRGMGALALSFILLLILINRRMSSLTLFSSSFFLACSTLHRCA